MKRVKQSLQVFIVLFAIVASPLFHSGTEAATPSPVGVIDVGYLINQHPDTAKSNESLKAEQEATKKEFAEKSIGLSDADKKNLELQLAQRLEQKRQQLLKPIVESINAAMKSVAEAKGLTIVVFRNQVAMGGTDITEDILKKLTGK